MDKLYYKEYYKLEREHWWFKARLSIIDFFIQEYITKAESIKILNVGAATGATTKMLDNYGDVISIEYDKDCAEFLSTLLNKEVINCSMTNIPLPDASNDLVCAFDVIEHIEYDNEAIKEANRVLKKNGYLCLTVPAFNSLWSRHDEINHHYRRYNINVLKRLLDKNGFKIEFSTYFNFWLFFPILLIRLVGKLLLPTTNKQSSGSDFEKFNTNQSLNKIFYHIFISEIGFFKQGIKLPFGVSAFIIGRKLL